MAFLTPPALPPDLTKKLLTPSWRLKNLYNIRTKDGRISLFEPNPAQFDYLKQETPRDIILKARQLGFSTVKLLTYLDRTLFTPNTTTCIMAHRKETMERLFRMIKFAYDMYPRDIPKLPAKYDNKNELFFPDFNSTIYVSLEARGDTIHNLHVSELAHMDNAEDRLIASIAAVPPNGRISIESTANGVGDYFYDFYHSAPSRGFKRFFYPWTFAKEYEMDPIGVEFTNEDRQYQSVHSLTERQLAWWKMQKSLFKDKFPQEYPITPQEAFLSSGNNIFPIDYLDNAVLPKPIVDSAGLQIWKHPHYHHSYSMGVDVSEGTGGDEHSIDIIDCNSGEQVLHWSGQCTVPLLSEKVEEYAHRYNEAFLVPEANNHGFSLIYLLDEKRLNIYKREKFDMGQAAKRVEKLGWLTTKRTKPLMIQQMIRAMYESDVKIYCQKTVEQMRTFLNLPDGSMGAAPGKHDDCVMSLCLAWQGLRVSPSKKLQPFSIFEDEPNPRVREFYGQVSY